MRNFSLLLLFLLITVSINQAQTTAADYNKRGLDKYAAQDLTGAITDFTKAIELDPKLAEAYINRAHIRYDKKNWGGAINDYTTAIKLGAENSEIYTKRGDALYTRNASVKPGDALYPEFGNYLDTHLAIADYTKAIKLIPDNAALYFKRGLALIARHRQKEAIADFTKVIELEPQNIEAYYYRANSKRDAGDIVIHYSAIDDYTKVIEMNPKYAKAYYERGYLLFSANGLGLVDEEFKGALERAIFDFTKTIELDSTFERAYTSRAFARNKKKDYSGAISDWDKAIELDPKSATSYIFRGELREKRAGDSAGALEDYTKAINLFESKESIGGLGFDRMAYLNRARLYRNLGKTDPAKADEEKASKIPAEIIH